MMCVYSLPSQVLQHCTWVRISLHSHTLHCLESQIAVSIKSNRPWRPLKAPVEFPRLFWDVCKSHIHDFFEHFPLTLYSVVALFPKPAQMKVKWHFLREKYCLIVKLKLPLQDGTWNAPSSARPHPFAPAPTPPPTRFLVFTPFHLQSTLAASKEIPRMDALLRDCLWAIADPGER